MARSRVELFEQIRRDWRAGGVSIRELAVRHHVHRRTVRQALASAVPPPRKAYRPRPRPAIGPYAAVIDGWLLADRDVPRKQRHTARRIWQRLVAEQGARLAEVTVSRYVARRRGQPALTVCPARPQGQAWPATCMGRAAVSALPGWAPFAAGPGGRHPRARPAGLGMLLDWLEGQPGQTWQDRWMASGADSAGRRGWRQVPLTWLRGRGHAAEWAAEAFFGALRLALAADIIRPSLPWLVTADFRHGSFTSVMSRHRDPEGFSRLEALCSADPDIPPAAASRTGYRASIILAAKGGVIADITAGDVLELLDAEAAAHGTSVGATHLFYRVLRTAGALGDSAPATLRQLRTAGQRTAGELIDRYRIACRPIRDLLADYLRERQPALDYASLESLAYYLGGLFWADLERHQPGIDSLHLPAEVADAWKQRLRMVTRTVQMPGGQTTQTAVPRVNYRECLTPVRAFYLDLA